MYPLIQAPKSSRVEGVFRMRERYFQRCAKKRYDRPVSYMRPTTMLLFRRNSDKNESANEYSRACESLKEKVHVRRWKSVLTCLNSLKCDMYLLGICLQIDLRIITKKDPVLVEFSQQQDYIFTHLIIPFTYRLHRHVQPRDMFRSKKSPTDGIYAH